MCSIAVLALMASPAWAGPAEAQASQSGAAQQPAKQEVQAAVPAKAGLSLDFGPAADLGKLEQSRGGAAETKNDMKLDGVVTGNSATNVVTGANSIDSGAFSNMSGIPVVIQNSGANVLIQSATIINVQFK
ncbi:hypothetical protein SRABI118_01592 [Massilia sp. Bi118]|nr:hypothetical protein SRABI118_01592 [Massilia sp. Bi118]